MQKKIHINHICLFLLILLFGCVATLKDYKPKYKPKSSTEEAIKMLLLKLEATLNNKDEQGNLALWHDNAKVMYGRDRKIASKKEYVKILPERMKAHFSYKLGAPKINIKGDKSYVNVTFNIDGNYVPFFIYLVRENNKWLMMSWEY